jgi:hypothetical protein
MMKAATCGVFTRAPVMEIVEISIDMTVYPSERMRKRRVVITTGMKLMEVPRCVDILETLRFCIRHLFL